MGRAMARLMASPLVLDWDYSLAVVCLAMAMAFSTEMVMVEAA
jgi:hypothetical protein